MNRGQEAPIQIETVHCLIEKKVYFKYDILFHFVERKMYLTFVASQFGMNMTVVLLFTTSGTFLGIHNTFYHKYFGYVRVLAQL